MSGLEATGVSILATSPIARASLPNLTSEWAVGIRRRAEAVASKASVNPQDLADDLEQAGLIAFWRTSQSYDPARGIPFEHYAQCAIRRAMISELRKQTLPTVAGQALGLDDPNLNPMLLPIDEELVDLGCELSELRDHVSRWVSTCPPRLRTVFALIYQEGLTQRAAGERLKVSQPRVFQYHQQLLNKGRRDIAYLTAA